MVCPKRNHGSSCCRYAQAQRACKGRGLTVPYFALTCIHSWSPLGTSLVQCPVVFTKKLEDAQAHPCPCYCSSPCTSVCPYPTHALALLLSVVQSSSQPLPSPYHVSLPTTASFPTNVCICITPFCLFTWDTWHLRPNIDTNTRIVSLLPL